MVSDTGACWVPRSPTELDQRKLKRSNKVLVPRRDQAETGQSLGRYDTEETEEQDPGFGGRRRMTWNPILVVIFYESSSAEQTDKQGPIRYQR